MALVDGAAYERAMAEIARLNDENERLSFDYERLAARKLTDEVNTERALADELAEAIKHVYSTGWLVMPPMVVQALAHHQEARA